MQDFTDTQSATVKYPTFDYILPGNACGIYIYVVCMFYASMVIIVKQIWYDMLADDKLYKGKVEIIE